MTDDEIKKIICKTASKHDQNMEDKRSLSSHVGSRWYRAPEISLLCKKYDSASDMWSIGCCIYELLSLLKDLPAKNRVLF